METTQVDLLARRKQEFDDVLGRMSEKQKERFSLGLSKYEME